MRTSRLLVLVCAARALRAPAGVNPPRARLAAAPQNQDPAPGARKAVAAVAGVGALETAYLTYSKLAAAPTLCASGCGSVLEGPYASVAGVPLAAFGLLAYVSVVLLALGDVKKTRRPLVVVTSAMAAASACLVGLLTLWLHQTCLLCFGSAALAFTNAWLMRNERGPRAPFLAATVLAALVQFSSVAGDVALKEARMLVQPAVAAETTSQKQLFSPPAVTTLTTPHAAALAKHLSSKGARMYGAYWCSHCNDQKRAFGSKAAADIDYVECAADGVDSRRGACDRRGVKGYPTWDIGGELYPGEKSLDELAELSGFKQQP